MRPDRFEARVMSQGVACRSARNFSASTNSFMIDHASDGFDDGRAIR